MNKSGGVYNAQTEYDTTIFFFECSNSKYLNNLKIWSRFFIDPLLKKKLLEKEVNAV